MLDLNAIQQALADEGLDGWLLYDFRGSNVLAARVLQFSDGSIGSRRCFYFIPRTGSPQKLVHRIEDKALEHLPGDRHVYLRWQEMEAALTSILEGRSRVAMEYSPNNRNPYISRVDAGTIELVRGTGIEVVSSGDLIQRFEATWNKEQWAMHQEAATYTVAAFGLAWQFIADHVRSEGGVKEAEVRDLIMDHFSRNSLATYHPPIVARGAHSGMPHYETGTGEDTLIREGDFVLIDLWAKLKRSGSVYSDLTRTAFVGTSVPDQYVKVFNVVAAARDAGIALVEEAFRQSRELRAYEVDDAVRGVIEKAGYGEYFVHRTGHSIGQEVHGNGANMDHLETEDDRRVLPGTCFSIEPGIYLPEFGVRSEVNVFVDWNGNVHVSGGPVQREIVPLLATSSTPK